MPPPRRLDFTDHRRDLGGNRYVYAVVSRRAGGLSIGVNLNPDKVCNFDCPYCQVDRRVRGGSPRIDPKRLHDELEQLLNRVRTGDLWSTAPFDTTAAEHRHVVDIAFAGDGEPTTPPEFPASAALVASLRDRLAPGVPVRLLTNSTLLHRVRVRDGLAHIDEAWCKLDAGTEPYFRLVDGTDFPFARVLRNLRELAALRPIVIQSMFLTMNGEGPSDAEIAAWVDRLREIAQAGVVTEVQVYTVARPPASAQVGTLPADRLAWIGAQAAAVGLSVRVV